MLVTFQFWSLHLNIECRHFFNSVVKDGNVFFLTNFWSKLSMNTLEFMESITSLILKVTTTQRTDSKEQGKWSQRARKTEKIMFQIIWVTLFEEKEKPRRTGDRMSQMEITRCILKNDLVEARIAALNSIWAASHSQSWSVSNTVNCARFGWSKPKTETPRRALQ